MIDKKKLSKAAKVKAILHCRASDTLSNAETRFVQKKSNLFRHEQLEEERRRGREDVVALRLLGRSAERPDEVDQVELGLGFSERDRDSIVGRFTRLILLLLDRPLSHVPSRRYDPFIHLLKDRRNV